MKTFVTVALLSFGSWAQAQNVASAYTCVDLGNGRYGLFEWTANDPKRIAAFSGPVVNEKGETVSAFHQCLEIANFFNDKLRKN